ncbi:Magnetosome protein MamF [Gammaproteobacteria bacterium]
MSQIKTVQTQSGLGPKILACMSYLGILALVPLVLNSDDDYIRFHARQGVVIWMWEVLAIYALVIPGGRLFFSISSFLCFTLSIIGLSSVLLGRAWKLPVIGNWAESI